MSDKEIVRWVQTELHAIVGFSDRNISEYIVSLASKAKSVSELVKKVVANDIPDNPATQQFCRQLFAKLPHSGNAVAKNTGKKSTNADLIRESETYGLLGDEDDSLKDDVKKEITMKKKKRDRTSHDIDSSKQPEDKIKHKSKSKSRLYEKGDSSEDETVIKRSAPKIIATKEVVTESDELQIKMDADIAERDAFVARIMEKEEIKTKKLAEKGLTTEQLKELATTGSISSAQDSMSTVEQLREISRQHYLEKREEKELKLLEMGMRDEDDLFDGVEMSKEELKRREVQKQILSLATDKYRFSYKDDGYHMPDGYEDANGRIDKAKREAALTVRYEEEPSLKTEQEQWEEDRVKQSTYKYEFKI
jgi:pre-mRNA-splicing factor ATP-dependent RNA helicase DHX16